VSLAEWKDDIEAAANGETSTVDDLRVRQHLRTCDECRAHYDGLVRAARVLAGTGEALPSEHHALLARLDAQLDAARPPAPAPSRRWWFFGAFAAVAAAAVLVVVTRPPVEPEREITLRGGGTDSAPSLSFSVYAKAKSGGAVRLLAQFPQSGEARASERDWLQVKAPSGVSVIAVSGDAVVVFDGGGSQTLAKGTWKLLAARGSVDDAKKAAALGVLVVDGPE
jgi:anti-sigma factor RsiW